MSSLFTYAGTIFYNRFMWIQLAALFLAMHIISLLAFCTSFLMGPDQYVEWSCPKYPA
jgi:hypothetical protein